MGGGAVVLRVCHGAWPRQHRCKCKQAAWFFFSFPPTLLSSSCGIRVSTWSACTGRTATRQRFIPVADTTQAPSLLGMPACVSWNVATGETDRLYCTWVLLYVQKCRDRIGAGKAMMDRWITRPDVRIKFRWTVGLQGDVGANGSCIHVFTGPYYKTNQA
jgi:hypothetical protein